MDPAQIIERERRWARPAALATFASVALTIVVSVASPVSGDGTAELLRSADEHASAVTNLSILQTLGFLLLLPSLLYLFGAALSRSKQMRGQMVGVLIAGPVFLASSAIVGGAVTRDSAAKFVDGSANRELSLAEATRDCRSDRADQGAESFRDEYEGPGPRASLRACAVTKVADDTAENALDDASLRPFAEGLGFAGSLGLAAALFYSCLYAMRVGLLTRFWGSLGMALGVFVLFALQLVLIWFLYFAFLVIGWVPGGRPPAWGSGEAIAWPTPGERAAESLEAEDEGGGEDASGEDAGGEGEPGAAPQLANPPREPGERRKRKRRR